MFGQPPSVSRSSPRRPKPGQGSNSNPNRNTNRSKKPMRIPGQPLPSPRKKPPIGNVNFSTTSGGSSTSTNHTSSSSSHSNVNSISEMNANHMSNSSHGNGSVNLNASFTSISTTNKGANNPPAVTYNSAQKRKMSEINAILSQPQIDLWALRELCITDGGLIDDAIRKKVYPKLLGMTNSPNKGNSSSKSKNTTLSTIGSISSSTGTQKQKQKNNPIFSKCIDAPQVELDTSRCTWHLLNGSQRVRRNTMQNKHKKRVRALLKRKQKRLGSFINLTLIQSYGLDRNNNNNNNNNETKSDAELEATSKLRYYQGYHDISCIILSVLGGDTTSARSFATTNRTYNNATASTQEIARETAQIMGMDLPCQILSKLSFSHLEDMMKPNFQILTQSLRLIIFPLLDRLDGEVHDYLMESGMEPFFCLPWIITWFSHDIRDTSVVKRLFDVFVASHPLMPIYLSIAMVLHPMNRMEILGSECDFAMLHHALTQLPMNSCSVGWVFKGGPMGGSYVGYEYEEVDDDDVSFDGSVMSQDVYREEGAGTDRGSLGMGGGDDDSLAPSLASESMLSGFDGSRVPFQELIELAVTYMRRIPPRSLVQLAQGYYSKEKMEELAGDVDAINFLNSPPEWAVASTIESDSPMTKRKRKKKTFDEKEEELTHSVTNKTAQSDSSALQNEAKYPHAIIAAGLGPDGDGEIIRRKQRRKMMRTGAIVIGVLSILIGIADRSGVVSFRSNTPKLPEKLTVSKLDIDMDIDVMGHNKEKAVITNDECDSDLSVADTDSSLSTEKEESVQIDAFNEIKNDDEDEGEHEDEEPPVEVVEIVKVVEATELEGKHPEMDPSISIASDSSSSPENHMDGRSDSTKVTHIDGSNSKKKIKVPNVPLVYSGSRSPAAQKVSSFVHQNVRPMYMEARVKAKSTREVFQKKMKPKDVGQKICREAMIIARSTKAALTGEAEVVLL